MCLGGEKRGLVCLRREFPKFSKRAAHIVLLNVSAEAHDTHTSMQKIITAMMQEHTCAMSGEERRP